MAIKVRSSQIELADAFVFAGATSVPTPTEDAHAATKAYVDGQLPDAFSGGDGIVIDASGDPDVIAMDLATNPALEFSAGKVQVKVKAESGGSITRDADGLYIADAAIANAKLANSTISGKALGANLDALAAGQGLALASPYDGSAGQTMDLALDGSTLAKGVGGLKVADNGIDTAQLAADCITSAEVADGAINANSMLADAVVTGPKLSVQPKREKFTGDNSTTVFSVASTQVYTGGEDGLLVFRNGLLVERVASSPSGQDEYTSANNAGAIDITFGTAPSTGDVIFFLGMLVS